jgi:hypothetical protein
MTIKNIVFQTVYETKNGEKKRQNTKIGTCFVKTINKNNGETFEETSLKFDFLPVDFQKGFIKIMDQLPKDETN